MKKNKIIALFIGTPSVMLFCITLLHALVEGTYKESAYFFGMFLGAVGMVACWRAICMAHAETFEGKRV